MNLVLFPEDRNKFSHLNHIDSGLWVKRLLKINAAYIFKQPIKPALYYINECKTTWPPAPTEWKNHHLTQLSIGSCGLAVLKHTPLAQSTLFHLPKVVKMTSVSLFIRLFFPSLCRLPTFRSNDWWIQGYLMMYPAGFSRGNGFWLRLKVSFYLNPSAAVSSTDRCHL